MKKDEILKELRLLASQSEGKLPKGAVSIVAEKLGVSYALVYIYGKEAGLISKYGRILIKKPYIRPSESYGPMHKDNPKDVIIHLSRLEGAINGIKAFHPKLAHYMQEQLDTIFRICYFLGMVERTPEKDLDLTKLSGDSKPGYEDIDKEISSELRAEKTNTNTIQDNIISNDLEDTNI